MPFALVPFLLLVIPVIEIAAFIAIGQQIGIMATLLMILVTAIIGTILLRIQGLGLLARIRGQMEAGKIPGRELGEGAMLLVAGILLLTPGFVTDGIGFSLFLPPVRSAIWSFLAKRIKVVTPGMAGGPQSPSGRPRHPDDGAGPVIDLDADEYSSEPDPNSPWRADKNDTEGR